MVHASRLHVDQSLGERRTARDFEGILVVGRRHSYVWPCPFFFWVCLSGTNVHTACIVYSSPIPNPKPDPASTLPPPCLIPMGPYSVTVNDSVKSLVGPYFDPKHGGCMRQVLMLPSRPCGRSCFLIRGVYGEREMKPQGTPWFGLMDVVSVSPSGTMELIVRFVGKRKPRPQDLVMKAWYVPSPHSRGTIQWSDGNTWKPMTVHRDQFKRVSLLEYVSFRLRLLCPCNDLPTRL